MGRHRNIRQAQILIQFMQLHKDIAIGNVEQRERLNTEKLWKSLTEELNANGPPIKQTGEWKKAWTDWRKACLKKLALPSDGVEHLSQHEQAIRDICGWTPTTVKEYESYENSMASTTSSDTPLKMMTTAGENLDNSLHIMDPLKQEQIDYAEAEANETQSDNNDSATDQNSLLKRRRRSPEQSSILLNFMLQHKEFAKGTMKIKNKGDRNVKVLWRKLVVKLNALGPPTKSAHAWKKTWTDWKKFCVKKLKKAEAKGLSRDFTSQEVSIIELCDLATNTSKIEGADDDEDDDDECEVQEENASSDSSDTPLKRKALLSASFDNNAVKRLKVGTDISNDFYDESFSHEELKNELNVSQAQSLAEIHAGVASIQGSLHELCKLMAEQNQELRKLTTETRRHNFVVEKEMIERKRERMK